MTEVENQAKINFEKAYASLTEMQESFKFIEAFSCLFKMLFWINSNGDIFDSLLEGIKSKSNAKVLTPFEKLTIKKTSLPHFVPNELKHHCKGDWKVFTNTTEEELVNYLKTQSMDYYGLSCFINLLYHSGNQNAVSCLCQLFFKEIDKEVIRTIRAFESDGELPILKEAKVNYSREYGVTLPSTKFPFKGREFFEQGNLINDDNTIKYTFDYVPQKSSISKKDIVECLKYMFRRSSNQIYYDKEKYDAMIKLVLDVVELRWFLGINIPRSLAALEDGNLCGNKDNRLFVKNASTIRLVSMVIADELGKNTEDVEKYLTPYCTVWLESSPEYQDRRDFFATAIVEDPIPNQINIGAFLERVIPHYP